MDHSIHLLDIAIFFDKHCSYIVTNIPSTSQKLHHISRHDIRRHDIIII